MKRTMMLWLGTISASVCCAQPIVYLDFVTHNEETAQWNLESFYATNRTRMLTLAEHFQANGITWNMQSDWVYLSNVIAQETPPLTTNTGGKNILRWLYEDRGVEMDPHAHESQYLYPDVVHLMDSIGLPESKVMGGTIYNGYNGVNLWMNLVDGQYGTIFPTAFWQPDYMMGGGTPNHVNDLKYYGFWNPQDTAHYLIHDPSSHLRHLGVGCSIKISDTTSVAYVVGQVQQVVTNVQSAAYPADGSYLQSIFFEQAGLNDPAFYSKVMAVADAVNAIVGTGAAQWKTFKQAYTLWETDYGAQVFQWECGQIATGSAPTSMMSAPQVYPTVFTDRIVVQRGTGEEHYELHDVVGHLVWAGPHIEDEDLSGLPNGVYLLIVQDLSARNVFTVVKE
ncbi:MAG: T9SS type A sorting domain-containing protein [Flavobacteriales bacterium]